MSPRASRQGGARASAAPIFAALGHELRLRLVARLCAEGPLSIVTLSEDATVTRQAVTKHLRALAQAGIVRGARRGRQRQRIWQLAPRRLDEARLYLERVSQQWDAALARLKLFVEE
jgi:DNA-binding transcriptional ArsR family regulator